MLQAATGGDPPAFLEAWKELEGGVFRRSLVHPDPLPPEVDVAPFLVDLGRSQRGPLSKGKTEAPLTRPIASGDLTFFDLETTGLSGGAGTIAFLATLGRSRGGDFVLEQYFLRDYPGETSFIEALLAGLGTGPLLASHNGRAFDWPLLRTRCVMLGRRLPEPRLHLDFLKTARRLWKSALGGANLTLLEEGLLGKRREGDIPGERIPDIWFDFVRAGDHAEMGAVISHNAEDVLGLAALVGLASRVFERPLEAAAEGSLDLPMLGRVLEALDRADEAFAVFGLAAERGDWRAALALARGLRRRGRAVEARRALALAGERYEALMEEARLAETTEGDLAAALDAARRAVKLAPGDESLAKALSRERRLGLRIAAASRARPARRRS